MNVLVHIKLLSAIASLTKAFLLQFYSGVHLFAIVDQYDFTIY
jgi:hypothetical protein